LDNISETGTQTIGASFSTCGYKFGTSNIFTFWDKSKHLQIYTQRYLLRFVGHFHVGRPTKSNGTQHGFGVMVG
jgi:hypothetical protein